MMPVCRYWDADEGWLLGGLCEACYVNCRAPREDDYAYGIDGDAFLTQDIPNDLAWMSAEALPCVRCGHIEAHHWPSCSVYRVYLDYEANDPCDCREFIGRVSMGDDPLEGIHEQLRQELFAELGEPQSSAAEHERDWTG